MGYLLLCATLLTAALNIASAKQQGDYRAVDSVLEPRLMEMMQGNKAVMTLKLQSVRYDSGVSAAVFEMPAASSGVTDTGTTANIAAAAAQQQQQPSAATVVEDHLKAAGGRELLSRIKDATLEFNIVMEGRELGATSTRRKAPASVRDEGASGANVGSPGAAWGQAPDGSVRAYGERSAELVKLQAALEANYMSDYARQGITARVVGVEEVNNEPAHAVEFSRGTARLIYLFGVKSKLLAKVKDEQRKATVLYGDYREIDGVLEPHRIQLIRDGRAVGITLLLKQVRYNTGISDNIFALPSGRTPETTGK